VALTVTGLPSDVTGAFDNATVNVDGSSPSTAKLTLTSLSSSAPVATQFNIVGTSGETTHPSPATLTVKPYITIDIPVNADSLTSFPNVTITAPEDIATNPVTINFVNLDSAQHEVHADGQDTGSAQNQLGHGNGTFGQGQADSPVRLVNAKGSYPWHLHDNPPPTGPNDGTITIQ
jgi:plastocyanin